MHTLQSQEILNRPVFALEKSEKVWTFWTLTENSGQIQNILNIDWTFWTDSEHSAHCQKGLNIRTVSEQILNIPSIVWKVWTESEPSEHCLNLFIIFFWKLEYSYIISFLIKFDFFLISLLLNISLIIFCQIKLNYN